MTGCTIPASGRVHGARCFVTPEAKGYADFMRSPSPRLGSLGLVLVLLGAGAAALAATPLYKWVDASGVTHYSDVPGPNSESVRVDGAQGYAPPPPRAAAAAPPARSADATASKPELTVTITHPEPGAVLWNADGHIAVGASVEPGLENGQRLCFTLDGTRMDTSGESATLPVARGEHSLVAIVLDADDHELARSMSVSFVVRQNTSITPPRGPGLPKKPHH